jgi:hypothetical protein
LPDDFYSRSRFLPDKRVPSRFAVGHTPSGWTTAHINSFFEPDDLDRLLSGQFSTACVAIMAQTVSEAYYVQVAEHGAIARILYFAGDTGEWLRNEGTPLPFEPQPLGTNIAEGSEPFYVFGREDVVAYCAGLGLTVWGQHSPPDWLILDASSPRH